MSDKLEQILECVNRIYESALDPSQWPETLTMYADIQGADAANIITRGPGSRTVEFAAMARINPDSMQDYANHFVNLDVWVHATSDVPEGRVVSGGDMIQKRELVKTEFYNDFLVKAETHHILTPILDNSEQRMSTVPVFRSKRGGDFEADESKVARLLGPHFKRALQIQRVLVPAALSAQAHAVALDHVKLGVVLVNAHGRVTYLNRSAEAAIAQDDGLSVAGQELRTSRQNDTGKLRRLIGDAVKTAEGDGLSSGGRLSVRRPSGQPSFEVEVTPLPLDSEPLHDYFQGRAARALIFIWDPANPPLPAVGELQSEYRLTLAEATVCRELLRGCRVSDVAEHLDVKSRTVRRHLERIFEKTGTDRQATLLLLLATSAAAILGRD